MRRPSPRATNKPPGRDLPTCQSTSRVVRAKCFAPRVWTRWHGAQSHQIGIWHTATDSHVDDLGACSVDFSCMSTTIRVSEQTRDRFAKLADATGRPMTQLLDEAADALERRLFFDQLSSRYEELRGDRVAWDEIEAERAVEAGATPDSSR